ncbi:hypothetical protein [Tenuibacillus multivorans]|uniref:Uncharacterized protein n=1 Tax=Tenuibacillus multivorans TaxID=237069 RepID=A0A1G9WL33_9BACI|nr:hypothetical protein [Tenuibacillus multivorans]GEL76497.1 hypothetical protein TMU01_07320 [Tenuibacillus multivorans]SDM84871.1 hypothetical protein SAMN05216498_0784 [Tenuibacillus multivorans]
MLESIFLILAIASFALSISLLIYEAIFKGIRNIKEMKLKPVKILFLIYVISIVGFLITINM